LDSVFKIYGSNQKLKYVIKPLYCQWGIWGRNACCFSKLFEVIFHIYTEEKYLNNPIPENSDGIITRKFTSFAQATLTDADIFNIRFPKNATAYDKLMIIGAVLMIDYNYFENNCDFC